MIWNPQPRQMQDAVASGAVIAAWSSVWLAARTLLSPAVAEEPGILPAMLALPALVAAFAVALWVARDRVRMGFSHNLATILLIASANLLRGDASASAQFVLALPVIFAAYHLHRTAAIVSCLVAIGGQAVTALATLPLADALHDILYSGVVLCSLTVLVGRLRDRQDAAAQTLAETVRVDALTGLYNRTVLEDAAAEVVTRGYASLLLIDLDHFKQINDVHGHPAGDVALTRVADVVRGLARGDDLVARMGGDELAVLMPGCVGSVARERAQQMVDAVAGLDVRSEVGDLLTVSISVGVASSSPVTNAEEGVEALYHAADAGLYRAKRAGRGRVGEPDTDTAPVPNKELPDAPVREPDLEAGVSETVWAEARPG